MIFLTMWLLIVNFFLNENTLDGISKLSLMQKIKTFFNAIRNFLECRFSKNDLECTLKKLFLCCLAISKLFLSADFENHLECTLEKILLMSFDCFEIFLKYRI